MDDEFKASGGIEAELVYDGGDVVRIPGSWDPPRPDQMVGTPREIVMEVAGRACYDSCGSGRPSRSVNGAEGFHEHIRKVDHLSVAEHCPVVVAFRDPPPLEALVNRPGVMVTAPNRVLVNHRAILEWDKMTRQMPQLCRGDSDVAAALGRDILRAAGPSAPEVLGRPDPIEEDDGGGVWATGPHEAFLTTHFTRCAWVDPEGVHENWVSLWLSMSRGASHEFVRHHVFRGVSQRSTRFVDEDGTMWVLHPVLERWLDMDIAADGVVCGQVAMVINGSRTLYRSLVDDMERWLVSRGVSKTSARKQARGAARGFLGNSLRTEMIFSASVWMWLNILRQRGSDGADAEIRRLAVGDGTTGSRSILSCLEGSRHGEWFRGLRTVPAKDGFGLVLAEGG